MSKQNSAAWSARLVLLGLTVAVGCSADDGDDAGEMLASSGSAPVVIYDDPYAPAMAGTPNPIGPTASARAEAFDLDGQLRIELSVAGFPATRTFGSHLHRLSCDDPMKAGGHYQHVPFPAGGMATDPLYANAANEAWLDFTTNASGQAEKVVSVDWIPRAGEASAIIFHDMASGVGGVSGAKLACLPLEGF